MVRSPSFARFGAGIGLWGLAAGMAGLIAYASYDWYATVPADALTRARYVGSATCAQCHQTETDLWHGSHHDRAMEPATDETVLGDFNDAEFSRFGVVTRFFRDGDKFMVHTEGPDGEFRDYEIKYTFGVEPLQQYMVEFPDGRIQVLRESWDARQGKWFYVSPADAEDIRLEPNDPLHWTGLAQNWNTMCAECHTTNYRKNYDLASDQYHSEYDEIDVSCEMCHGPGSLHVELAESKTLFWDRTFGYGMANPLKNVSVDDQLETCAPCHSRRSSVHGDYHAGRPYHDHFDLVPLQEGLYHADGQILDEVFVAGSFLQSKMYHKGVRCTDCHDPHSLRPKYEGNQLCAQCHLPAKYDTYNHHRHQDAAATQCVNCHMPSRVYMGIDDRRDHSLRVPRPDLSVKLGTPNACNDCHTKPQEDAAWAAAAVERWYGPQRPDDPHYAHALDAGRRGLPAGEDLLLKTLRRPETPAIVRATALELLAGYPSDKSLQARRAALTDPSPQVRLAALRALPDPPSPEQTAARQRMAPGRPNPLRAERQRFLDQVAARLGDPARVVRMAAAARIVAAGADLANTPHTDKLAAALEEYRRAQTLHLDRAPAHLHLAQLSLDLAASAARSGDSIAQQKLTRNAVDSLRHAIERESYLTGPRNELANLLDRIASEPQLAGLRGEPAAAAADVERLRREEADLLRRDAGLLPNSPSPRYRRGMLLYLLGEGDEARQELLAACKLGPEDYGNWLALALLCEQQERWQEAVAALERMAQLRPADPTAREIFLRIRQTLEARGMRVETQVRRPAGAATAAAPDQAEDSAQNQQATGEEPASAPAAANSEPSAEAAAPQGDAPEAEPALPPQAAR